MTTSSSSARGQAGATIATTRRLLGVDAARALALIGMMATHLEARTGADGEPTLAYLLASGKASALFAVLAGVGLALASGGPRPPTGKKWQRAAAGTAARGGVLFAIGLIIGGFDSGLAVILTYYGVLFLVAIPFLRLPAGWLIGLGVSAALVTPAISQQLRQDTAHSLTTGVPNLATLIQDPSGTLTSILLTGYYPVLTWTAYLFIGLGVGRMALGRARVALTITAVGAATAAATWFLSSQWLDRGGLDALREAGLGGHITSSPIDEDILHTGFYGTTPTTSWSWLGIASPHSGAPPDLLHTIGAALAVLGLTLLLAQLIKRAIWPLAAVGSMTFTLYSLHVVLIATVLPASTEHALLIHVLVALVIAVPWRRLIGRGPLEALAAAAARAAGP